MHSVFGKINYGVLKHNSLYLGLVLPSGYCTINVNDDPSIIIKWSLKLIDAARGVIYDCHIFIVQAAGGCQSLINSLSSPLEILLIIQFTFLKLKSFFVIIKAET